MQELTLHSTMFLLIPQFHFFGLDFGFALHSTMFLLIPFYAFVLFLYVLLYIPLCFY